MRPRTLDELWAWAYAEGRAANLDAPSRLHVHGDFPPDSSPPRWRLRGGGFHGDGMVGSGTIIGAPPFTRGFTRYLEDGRAMTPIRRALLDMRPERGLWSLELRILWAIVEGAYWDQGTLAVILRCDSERLRAVAHRALAYLHEKTEREVASEPKRTPLQEAGERGIVSGRRAQSARGEYPSASEHRARRPRRSDGKSHHPQTAPSTGTP